MKSKFHIELIQMFRETGMSADFNPNLQEAIFEVVESQIADDNPPETHQTYKRLLREGRSGRDAKVLIASVVAVEMFEVINRREPFNHMEVCPGSRQIS